MPANRCPIELVRPHVGEEFEVVDEDEQRRVFRISAEREFGLEEVAVASARVKHAWAVPGRHVPRASYREPTPPRERSDKGAARVPAERAASLLEGRPSVGT